MTTDDQFYFPASYAQQRLWILDRLEPGNAGYNVATAFFIEGDLNRSALQKTIKEIVRRHESLRTRFGEAEGMPVQIISAGQQLNIQCVKLTTREQAEQRAREEASRPFDLDNGPLIRVSLLNISQREHLLVVVMHHIISDGWSIGVFYKELAALYDAFSDGNESPLPELEIQYADYAQWQRNWLNGEVLEQQLKYWRAQLDGAPPLIDLPTDFPRAPGRSKESGIVRFEISEQVTRSLKRLSRDEGATLFMTLLGAFNTLLYRYTAQKDVVIGTPIANRNHVEIEDLIGYFANTLVMRTRLDGDPSFRELLRRVKDVAMAAYANQDVPFEKLVEELHPERDLSSTPIFQVLFVLQNMIRRRPKLKDLTLNFVMVRGGTAKFDLELMIMEGPHLLQGFFEYNSDLHSRSTIERMVGHFLTLLESITASPDGRISELDIMSKQEQELILAEWNHTATEYLRETLAHELFEQQVARTPARVALVYEDEKLTYEELNRKANQLAHYLIKEGAGPELIVGLCLDRSAEMIIAMLAVLKSGAAYLPLDPSHPTQRLLAILADANARLVITNDLQATELCRDRQRIISVDIEFERFCREPNVNPPKAASACNLAYLIYTSGSTGIPKGVAVEHRQLVNYVSTITERLDLPEKASYATVSTLAADLCNTMIYPALSIGGELHVVSQELASDNQKLAEYFDRHSIDCLKIVPSHLEALLIKGHSPSIVPKRRLVLGGEASDWEMIRRIRENSNGCRIFNHYGPTETTVGVLTDEVEPVDGSKRGGIDLGRPIGNTQAYILGDRQEIVPIGAIGELYVSGKGLTRGYLNKPDLTAERFLPNPYSNVAGERMYRTGDLARYKPDGKIQYLGRTDRQVKIRGYRIETGEIEQVIKEAEAVNDVVVIATPEAEKRLVAYVVEEKGATVDVSELKRQIRQKLPDYMIPTVIMKLDRIPLTAAGKVNLIELPPAHEETLNVSYVEPANPTEEIIAAIWGEVMRRQRVSVADNFFDLGGHSLLATQVVSRLRDAFQIKLPLRSIFVAPTVARLAEVVEQTILEDIERTLGQQSH